MELTHTFTVPASVEDAWAAFNDLERIAPCFPGASLTSYDGESFEGLVKVKLGPISLQYGGAGRFAERDEVAHRAVIEAKGKDKRGNGTASATITASLASAGDAATAVTVATDLTITGRPAQFGRGVLQDVSDRLLAQFAGCLETKLGEPAHLDEPASGSESPGPDASADSAERGTTPSPELRFGATAQQQPAPSSTGSEDARTEGEAVSALPLAAAVLPSLLRRYAPQIVGAVVAVWLLRKLLRRR